MTMVQQRSPRTKKRTHTDRYLNFVSDYHLEHKPCAAHTLLRRPTNLVTEHKDKKREGEHVRSALQKNGYPGWIYNLRTKQEKQDGVAADGTNSPRRIHVGLPYVRGLFERLQSTFSSRGIAVHHKPYG